MLGRRIGHYVIEDQIGSGGLGVVYRATDTHLDRAVAIKATRVDNVQSLKRVRQEAKAAARLDHPYICKVFELLEHDDQLLIVMEYLEGQTLAERLEDGPLPLDEALEIGKEVAEALELVHSNDIVHRDIKPSNIMLTGGHVKVMDFGVVRVERERDEDDKEATTSLTADGVIVGTPYYMAPEQITGDPIGPHSDIWALGVVLYEALSGRYPFPGESRQQYLRNVVTGDAVDLRVAAPDVPRPIASVVMRCLAHSPAERFQSAGELARELDRVSRLISAETLLGLGRLAPSRRWIQVATIVFVGVLAVLAWVTWFGVSGDPPRFDVLQRSVTTWAGMETQGRVSPDGRFLSFVADRDGSERVWRRGTDDDTPAPVTPAEDTAILSHGWSPDSSEIAYVGRRGNELRLKVVPAEGGEVLRQAAIGSWPGNRPEIVRWYEDALYLRLDESLFRFSSDLATSSRVSPDLDMAGADVCPHQDRLAYSKAEGGRMAVWVSDLDGGNSRRLTPPGVSDAYPRWRAGDGLVFLSDRSGAQAVYLLTDLDGDPVQLASGFKSVADVSPDGDTVIVEQLSEAGDVWSLDPSTLLRVQLTSDSSIDLWPSRAGSVLAFQRIPAGFSSGVNPFDARVYVADSRGEKLLADGYAPLISPSARVMTFLRPSQRRGRQELWYRDLEGQTEERVADDVAFVRFRHEPPLDRLPAAVTWAGETLYAGVADPKNGEVSILRFEPGSPAERIRPDGDWLRVMEIRPSPDGRWLAFVGEREDTYQLIAHSLDGKSAVPLFTDRRPGLLYTPGWIDSGRLVLARSVPEGAVEVLEVFTVKVETGETVRVFRGQGFAGTARLAPSAKLYFTAAVAGIHNLFELAVADSTLRQLTDNQMTGVTYSTPFVTPDGVLVYTYHANNVDVKLLRLSRAGR